MATENTKLDQGDLIAQVTALKGDSAKLTIPGLTLPANLVEGANSIHSLTAEKDSFKTKFETEQGNVAKLTGDKTKLAAGATLPTDLVAAANEIAQLKAEKISVDDAVAKRIVALGLTNPTAKKEAGQEAAGSKSQTLTEKVLAAQGCKTLAESEEKFRASCEAAKV